MDQIYEALCDAHAAVKWFALGDAIRLTDQIHKVCKAYSNERDNEVIHKQMVRLAEITRIFLSVHGGPPNRDESYKALSEAIQNHKLRN